MKKVLSLFAALLLVFALTACTDDTALLDLTDTVDALQTQLNASDVSIEDLEAAKDALQLEVNALTADLEAAKTGNTELDADITALQGDLDAAQLLLSTSITALSGQLADVTAAFGVQLAAVAEQFQLALDESNQNLQDLQDNLDASNQQIEDLLNDLAVFELPIIYGIEAYEQNVFETLDYKLNAFDIKEGNLTSSIVMVSEGSFDQPGEYPVYFEVTDSEGFVGQFTVYVSVGIDDVYPANYLSGVDLSKLDADNKGILFAAAESYLLENVYAGVPLYTSANRILYSDRVSLYSPEYNGVMGFGVAFSTLTTDDSTVFMNGSEYGNVGEFTWRSSFESDPTSLNPWTADDSSSSDYIEFFTGSLYTFYFDAPKTGYVIDPDLASADPIPMDAVVENGRTYAKVWQIPVREDLVWTYHEDIDTSAFPAGHEILDAEDYLWTWKYALDNTWFRAISGGGDFITGGIKNAAEYVAGDVAWEDVGMDLVDGNIQLTYKTEKTMFNIKYQLAGSWTPINEDLYMSLTPTEATSTYGTSPETVAASGVYIFETFTSGQYMYFAKNDSHPHADLYHYTGRQFRQISSSETIFAEFLEGRLESSSIPSTEIDNYLTDPRIKVSPDATTWRLMINAFGTEEKRDEYILQYPEFGLVEDFVPEPILQYTEMRQALYFGFDRYHNAVEVVKTYLPAFTYFTSTYFLDAESGIGVRGTDAGAAIVTDFGGDTYGYVPDAAVAFFKSAVQKGIDDGFYEVGTVTNYTVIELGLTWASSGNTNAQALVAVLEQGYEELLVDDENFVTIDIVVTDVDFPTNYYNFMMVANTDLGIGGISGSLLDAPSFLDVFNDDNKGGFTLNWGIDTHSVNIPVVYFNNNIGETVSEFWSYNALVAALNGNVYIRGGVEQSVFKDLDALLEAYVDIAGSEISSSTDGSDLAQYVLGQTVEEMAIAEGFDAVYAKIIVTADDANILFVVSETDGGFELIAQHSLFTDAKSAIESHSGYPLTGLELMTDADVAANEYLTGLGAGYTTIAEWAIDTGAPVEFTQLYATDFGWDDAYVVLFIDGYYIGWAWL